MDPTVSARTDFYNAIKYLDRLPCSSEERATRFSTKFKELAKNILENPYISPSFKIIVGRTLLQLSWNQNIKYAAVHKLFKEIVQDISHLELIQESEYRELAETVNTRSYTLKSLQEVMGLTFDELKRIARYVTFLDLEEPDHYLSSQSEKNGENFNTTQMYDLIYAASDTVKCLLISRTTVTKIPRLSACEKVFCDFSCVAEIGELPVCQELHCVNTPIKRLPYMPVVTKVYCSFCPILTTSESLSQCIEFDYRGCAKPFKVPKLAKDARIVN